METTTAPKQSRIDDADIVRLRSMSVDAALHILGLHAKADRDYQPQKNSHSKRLNVTVKSTVFELVVTGPKWYDSRAKQGGGGAIDLTMHLYREPFKKAVQRLITVESFFRRQSEAADHDETLPQG